jgi:hypothetical protein
MNGNNPMRPYIFDRLFKLAFVFLCFTLGGFIAKYVLRKKRNDGRLISRNEQIQLMVNGKQQFEATATKSVVYKVVISIVLIVVVALVM